MSATTDRIPSPNPQSRAMLRGGLAALAAVTAVGVVGLWPTGNITGASSDTSSIVERDELAPNRPGGSVYDSQVPAAARDGIDELAPNRPGGSVYDSQVPAAARDGVDDR